MPRLRCPSLQHFRERYLLPQRPVILEGVVDHWPCMKKWRWVATSLKARPPMVAPPKAPCTRPTVRVGSSLPSWGGRDLTALSRPSRGPTLSPMQFVSVLEVPGALRP